MRYYDFTQGGRYVAGRDDFGFPKLIFAQWVLKKFGFRSKTNVEMLSCLKNDCKLTINHWNPPTEGCICVANTFFSILRRHTHHLFTSRTKLGLYNMIAIVVNLQKFDFLTQMPKKVASTLQNGQNCSKIGLILTFANCYVTSFTWKLMSFLHQKHFVIIKNIVF